MLAGAGRPRKACGQCKGQKVRCSGDKPACKRCSRLKHVCIYGSSSPVPGGTRRVSKPSTNVTTADAVLPGVTAVPTSTLRTTTPHFTLADPNPTASSSWGFASAQPPPPPLPAAPSQEYYLGIPTSLIRVLVETYYANVYNASLLLHKRTFLDDLASGRARPYVVLSVCAFALNFHHETDEQSPLRDHGFSVAWADQAGKLSFQDIENPNEDNVAAFLNLALFWYSQGSWRRSCIHKGNATWIAHLLGLGTERLGVGHDDWESEKRRRRFWAAYLMHCHAIDWGSVAVSNEMTLRLSMPWRNEDFDLGVSRQPRVTLESGGSNGGVYCELIKAMSLWAEVNALVKSPESSISERVVAIHALEARISTWWSNLPDHLRLSASTVASVPTDLLPNRFFLHIVHHQCLCALHASMVPLFCWSTGEVAWSTARHLSAQVAFENANAASVLIRSVLENFPRLSALPSFVAYAAYCGCAIQIPFMWSSDPTLRERVHENVKANVRVIQLLAKYWKFAALLENHVTVIYKIHAKQQTVLDNEPKFVDGSKLARFKVNHPKARDSILGHNRILWKNGVGYPQQGEDPRLDVDDSDDPQSTPSTPDRQSDLPTLLPQEQSIPPYPQPGINDATAAFDQFPPNEAQTLDFFRPFLDPEMLDLFPHGQDLGFSHFEVSPSSLDFFDLYAPPPTETNELFAPAGM